MACLTSYVANSLFVIKSSLCLFLFLSKTYACFNPCIVLSFRVVPSLAEYFLAATVTPNFKVVLHIFALSWEASVWHSVTDPRQSYSSCDVLPEHNGIELESVLLGFGYVLLCVLKQSRMDITPQ